VGYWEDLTANAQQVTSDPQETATPHMMASITPPQGVGAMSVEDAQNFINYTKTQKNFRNTGFNGVKFDYANRILAADRASRGYVQQELHNSAPSIALGWLGKALNYPLDKVQRGVSTALAVDNEAAARSGTSGLGTWVSPSYWKNEFSGDVWSKAWDDSKGVSPGQAFFAKSDPSGGDLKARLQESRKWGQETWAGRLATGSLDFAINIGFDPVAKVGGKLSDVRKAQKTVKVGEAADTVKVADALARGEKVADASQSATRSGKNFYNFIKSTDNLKAPQLLKLNVFKQSSDSAVLAHLFENANGIVDDTARFAAKRDVLAAAIGDPTAKAKLAEQYADLAAQLERVQAAPELNQLERFWHASPEGVIEPGKPVRFTVDHKGEIDYLNQPKWEAELRAAETKIEEQLGLIERQQEIAGEVTQLKTHGVLATAMEGNRVRQASTEKVVYNGPLGRMITVIGGAPGARAPHSINIADTRLGMQDFEAALGRSKWMPKDRVSHYLSKYASASSATERGRIVDQAESESHKLLAAKHGLDPEHADFLLNQARQARTEWRNYLHAKVFSGEASKIVSGVDPEGGGFAFDRAFISSQLRDTAMFMDPRTADKAMAFAAKHKIPDMLRIDPNLSVGEQLSDLGSALLAGYMRTWKLAALLRPAYLPRVQFDSQFRNVVAMGTLAWAAGVKDGTLNLARNLNPVGKEGRDKFSLLTKMEEHEGYPVQPALNADELAMRKRMTAEKGSTMSRAMIDHTDREVANMLGSNQWEIVKPGDLNWTEAYLRGVNRQIRNSSTARAIVDGMNESTLIRLARKSGNPINAEWRNFKTDPKFAGDEKAWLDAVRQHVDHMLPAEHPELRDIVSRRNLKQDDIKMFENSANRFDVHGEAYTPIGKAGALTEAINKVTSKWYKIMSDMPEQVMARQPLYNYSFRENMKDKIDRWVAENEGDIPDVEFERMRKSADSLARKRVADVLFDLERMSPGSGTRNVLFPFFSAWEDTMKKWGALFYENPELIRRTQQAFALPQNTGLIHQDDPETKRAWLRKVLGREPTDEDMASETGRYFFLPKSWLKHFGISDDFVWKVDPKSFNIIFQGDPPLLPGPGPVAQVFANWAIAHDKRLAADVQKNPILSYILPYGATPDGGLLPVKGFADSLVPAWAKSLASMRGSGEEYANTFNMLRNVENSRYYRGERKALPTADEISKKTRNYFIVKSISQGVMPVSVRPGPSEEIQFYIDQMHSIQRQWKLTHPDGKKLNADDPLPAEIFYERYPKFFDLSISLSANPTGVDASLEAQTAAEKYSKAIANTPEIGWALAGTDNLIGEFNAGIYDYQKSKTVGMGSDTTYRGQKNPRENFNEPSVKRGWMEYYKAKASVDAELAARGLNNIGQKGAADLRQSLADYRVQLAKALPGWGADYDQQDSSKVEKFISDVQGAWKTYPDLAQRRDMQLLQSYIDGRRQVHELLKARPKHKLDDPSNADLLDSWGSFTKALTDQDLAFSYMYSRVLEGDDLNKELLGVG